MQPIRTCRSAAAFALPSTPRPNAPTPSTALRKEEALSLSEIVFEGIRERLTLLPLGLSSEEPVISPDGKVAALPGALRQPTEPLHLLARRAGEGAALPAAAHVHARLSLGVRLHTRLQGGRLPRKRCRSLDCPSRAARPRRLPSPHPWTSTSTPRRMWCSRRPGAR